MNLIKPMKEKIKYYEPSAPPYYDSNFVNINSKDMVCWRETFQ